MHAYSCGPTAMDFSARGTSADVSLGKPHSGTLDARHEPKSNHLLVVLRRALQGVEDPAFALVMVCCRMEEEESCCMLLMAAEGKSSKTSGRWLYF